MSKEKPSTIKYLYKGTTLRKYCKEHNLNYDTVVKRIKNKKMSIEQARDLDIERFKTFYHSWQLKILLDLYHEDLKAKNFNIKADFLSKNISKNNEELFLTLQELDNQHQYKRYYEKLIALLMYKNIDEESFQRNLEKINEKSEKRKGNGVYYTPEDVSTFIILNSFALLNNNEGKLFNNINSLIGDGNEKLYVNMRATFWIKSFITQPYKSNEYKEFLISKKNVHLVNIILNSSLFWWLWVKVSDCWHLTNKEFSIFTTPDLSNVDYLKVETLSNKINEELDKTKETVNTKQTMYEYKHKRCKHIIDQIDDYLALLYGFSAEEINYIKHYKENYRLGISNDECN